MKTIDELAERFMDKAKGSMGLALLYACHELQFMKNQTSHGYMRDGVQPDYGNSAHAAKHVGGKDVPNAIDDDWIQTGAEG